MIGQLYKRWVGLEHVQIIEKFFFYFYFIVLQTVVILFFICDYNIRADNVIKKSNKRFLIGYMTFISSAKVILSLINACI